MLSTCRVVAKRVNSRTLDTTLSDHDMLPYHATQIFVNMSSLSSYCHTYLGGDFPYIVAAVTTILSLAIPIITTNHNVAGIRLTHGAGKENRTLISSLEGWRSTIELHLHLD